MYDDTALELAARHNGVVAGFLLRDAGMTKYELRSLRGSRHWWSPGYDVFVRKGAAATRDRALTIAVLSAGRGAALSHEPACFVWGQTSCRTKPADVVRTSRSGPRPRGVVVHSVRLLPAHLVTDLRGIPVVRPELCALQLFSSCSYGRAERLVERMWSMRLLSGRSLRGFIAEMGAMGRDGTAGVRRYLDDRPGNYEPSASNLETRVMQILRDAGIDVRRQVDVGSGQAWTGRVDFVVDGLPVVIEVQSSAHHLALTDRASDRRRREELEASGFIWVEVWSDDVWAHPSTVVDLVRSGIDRARERQLRSRVVT